MFLLNSRRFGRILAASGKDRAIRLNKVFGGRNSALQKLYTASIPCAEGFRAGRTVFPRGYAGKYKITGLKA
jgi:hypothetical protein